MRGTNVKSVRYLDSVFRDRILCRELRPPFLPDLNVGSVRVVAKYTDIHVSYDILVSVELWYPAALWSLWCRLNQLIL